MKVEHETWKEEGDDDGVKKEVVEKNATNVEEQNLQVQTLADNLVVVESVEAVDRNASSVFPNDPVQVAVVEPTVLQVELHQA